MHCRRGNIILLRCCQVEVFAVVLQDFARATGTILHTIPLVRANPAEVDEIF